VKVEFVYIGLKKSIGAASTHSHPNKKRIMAWAMPVFNIFTSYP
jgi:hypothetical protein